MIADQIAVFAWLREVDPGDERSSGGRLRRTIEEDWAPPPGFESAAARAAREREAAAAARRSREERARWVAEHEAERARATDRRRAALARIGVGAEDQELWRRILASPSLPPTPRLAPLDRAFFHAPRDGAPALVILRDEADLSVLSAARHAGWRAEIARRGARQSCLSIAHVRYAHYEQVVALLRGVLSR